MKINYIFGSVSHGTMRSEDLIPCFISTLEYFSKKRAKELLKEYDLKSIPNENEQEFYEWEDADFLLEKLFDILNEYAPPYFYFGAHPGDGSDYGFWLSEIEQYFDGLKVSDLSELNSEENKDYIGEVLHVNDHGNTSLYYQSKRKLKEIWAIV